MSQRENYQSIIENFVLCAEDTVRGLWQLDSLARELGQPIFVINSIEEAIFAVNNAADTVESVGEFDFVSGLPGQEE